MIAGSKSVTRAGRMSLHTELDQAQIKLEETLDELKAIDVDWVDPAQS
jgi:hypothetical protein